MAKAKRPGKCGPELARRDSPQRHAEAVVPDNTRRSVPAAACGSGVVGFEPLPPIKRWTNGLEGPPPRRVNLDPGHVTLSKLVLASTKDFAHRIYLADGIYAEVTLTWTKGACVPRDWTYPDYRTAEYIDFPDCVRRTLAGPARIR